MNFARIPAVLLSLTLAVALAACGADKQPAQKSHSFQSVNAQVAETEGIYLDIEGFKYQVQVSRQLNPALIDDRDYLIGVSADDRSLSKDEEWFGVWMRAENVEHGAKKVANDFVIKDTQENVYRPLPIAADNVFAYRGQTTVRGGKIYPDPNSPAGERQPNGALLLFKIKRFSIDNRPLELIMTGQNGQQAIVNLDV